MAENTVHRRSKGKTALILAGGGIMGAAYEIGVLTALDKLFKGGFSSRRFDIFVGVSSGSVISALVANKVRPADMYRAIMRNETSSFNFTRKDIYRFELWRLLTVVGKLLASFPNILNSFYRQRWTFSLSDFFHMLQEQLPAGIFHIDQMEAFLRHAFYQEGLRNDFSLLERELYIPAYDLDLGEREIFGGQKPSQRSVAISQAITASCAIPFFFEPYQIDGRDYIDALTGRVAHLDIAIDRGAKLIFVVNPRVPIHNDSELSCLPTLTSGECGQIRNLGATYAWEQAQRIGIQEKFELALEICRRDYPDVDVVVIQPDRQESSMFFQNPMSDAARKLTMQNGYNYSLGLFYRSFEKLKIVMARHGIEVTNQRLSDLPPATFTEN
ncbi:patatin-like phospholipase family protein [Malonomonas rubra]|uniref:patatin-like phospholipase family protein n=1 Tax=Malonomonas rubra TaxID=57040 RepID=UPI0026F10685|nr:patatin-like phospholipase family protein [Malonomonas rubra]